MSGGWEEFEDAVREAGTDPERRDALSLDVIEAALRSAASHAGSENHARAYRRALDALSEDSR